MIDHVVKGLIGCLKDLRSFVVGEYQFAFFVEHAKAITDLGENIGQVCWGHRAGTINSRFEIGNLNVLSYSTPAACTVTVINEAVEQAPFTVARNPDDRPGIGVHQTCSS